jgi:HPr kinase/phosphorylase
MNEGMGDPLPVRQFYQKAKIPIQLRLALGRTGFSKVIKTSASVKDSLPLPLWGKSEIQKMERMSPIQRKDFIRQELKNKPCLVLSDGLSYPQPVKQFAKEKRIALFVTPLSRSKSKAQLKKIFSAFPVPQQVLPGGLLNIFGQGILITGDSGVGKSESALELISRGHFFISDDVVQIQKDAKGNLIGSAVPLSRNFMEIRGLGIINIQKIFGDKSIYSKTEIDLIVMLKKWKAGKDYDRLGLKFPESRQMLGVTVPKITIPVAPGRNIATLIEVACKVFMLKQQGYDAALEITEKLDRAIAIG